MPNVSFIKPLIYLDNNATTACSSEVLEAMLPYYTDLPFNASSTHIGGRAIHKIVEGSRDKLAKCLSVRKYELFFNSGATEGINWLFLSLLKENPDRRKIVVSSVEHKAVLNSAHALQAEGFQVVELPVSRDGTVSLDIAKDIIDTQTALVSVQFANNETGVIHPITELAELAHQSGAIFHCDAVQGLGKEKLDLTDLGVDCATFSAHKVHGPKGVGALYIKGGANHWKWKLPFQGGPQENGIRPGTVNVPGVVGFGKAVELISSHLAEHISYLRELQVCLEDGLKLIFSNGIVHGEKAQRIPNTTNFCIPGCPSDMLISNLSRICISNGSACNSGTIGSSHVLKAMGIPDEEAECCIRISTSTKTTKGEIEIALEEISRTAKKIGEYMQ